LIDYLKTFIFDYRIHIIGVCDDHAVKAIDATNVSLHDVFIDQVGTFLYKKSTQKSMIEFFPMNCRKKGNLQDYNTKITMQMIGIYVYYNAASCLKRILFI
jgi:hypothetical protein